MMMAAKMAVLKDLKMVEVKDDRLVDWLVVLLVEMMARLVYKLVVLMV